MAFGYRVDEVDVPQFDEKIHGFKMKNGDIVNLAPIVMTKNVRTTQTSDRPIAMATLGCHVEGAALPHPDLADTDTACAGALYRFCRLIPGSDSRNPEFNEFVKNWLIENLEPLDADSDTSFETWIVNTPYSQSRKEELKRKYYAIPNRDVVRDELFKVKSFVKDETYPEYKHARAINSRSDEFKVLVGPIFQLISEKLFARPEFIKKIPLPDRPQYILDNCYVVGEENISSDFTSFEAHFEKERMLDCEMELVYHMVQHLPAGRSFCRLVERAKIEVPNHIVFKNFWIKIKGKRMSGEMDTSLSNGFSNLMMLKFLCKKNGNTQNFFAVEGDDAIGRVNGKPPPPSMLKDFGISIKLQLHKDINHASFCGMVFDLEDKTNVTDPIQALVSFGWTSRKYAKSKSKIHLHLLRAKALSLAYQYPHCPILCRLAKKMCDLTRSLDVRSFLKARMNDKVVDAYKMQIMLDALDYFSRNSLDMFSPKRNTRQLVQELYGVTVADQLKIEDYIDSMQTVQPINCPIVQMYFKESWCDYYDRYVVMRPLRPDLCEDTSYLWPRKHPRPLFNSKMF